MRGTGPRTQGPRRGTMDVPAAANDPCWRFAPMRTEVYHLTIAAMMTVWRRFCSGILLVLAVACGGDDRSSGKARRDSAAAGGALALLLDVPATVRAGEEVPVAVTVVNRGAAAVEIGGLHMDVVVTRTDGTEVWRRSRHEPTAPPARPEVMLRPSEMRGSGWSWNQRDDGGRPVHPGTYRIRAEAAAVQLKSEPRMVTISP